MTAGPSSAAYVAAFRSYLNENEEVVEYGLARAIFVRERKQSTGALIVTSARLVHWPDGATEPGWQVPRSRITQVRTSWAPWRMRLVKLAVSGDDAVGSAGVPELQANVRFARRLHELLA